MTDKPDNKPNDSKRITFGDFDKLSLKPFAENLLQNMEKGIASSIGKRGAYTISLNAEFGNGKTTFLKMFQHFIEDEKSQDYNVIFINAWESDFYDDPIIAILSELSNYIKKENKWKYNLQKIVNIIGKIGKTTASQILLSIAQTAVQWKTGLNLDMQLKQLLKKIQNSIGEETFKNFNQRKKIIQEIKTFLLDYTKKKKLLIIVDELDRARPDYAVHFLEDIKHFFDIENVIFLVGVNRQQMESTVKCLYGQELNFEGYYRKFFKQEIDLPDPYKEAQKFVDTLIEKSTVKYPNQKESPKSPYYIENSSFLSCKMFSLTLREIEEFMRIFEMILSRKNLILDWLGVNRYSFFICLFMKEREEFDKILSEIYTSDQFDQFLSKQGFDYKNAKQGFDYKNAQHESDDIKQKEKSNLRTLLGQIHTFSPIEEGPEEEVSKRESKFRGESPVHRVVQMDSHISIPPLTNFAIDKSLLPLSICKNIIQFKYEREIVRGFQNE